MNQNNNKTTEKNTDKNTTVNSVKKIEGFQFNLEKFTQETLSNITVEKGIIISCIIFTVLCAIIGFWYLIFGNSSNQKYYNYKPKMNSSMLQMPQMSPMNQVVPVTSSISKFMYLN